MYQNNPKLLNTIFGELRWTKEASVCSDSLLPDQSRQVHEAAVATSIRFNLFCFVASDPNNLLHASRRDQYEKKTLYWAEKNRERHNQVTWIAGLFKNSPPSTSKFQIPHPLAP